MLLRAHEAILIPLIVAFALGWRRLFALVRAR
jgi:hypothetical protein